MGKTNPLNDKDMAVFIASVNDKPETEQSWNLKVADLDETTFDLSVKNPNTPEEAPLRAPQEILAEMKSLDEETSDILTSIEGLL
jgi:type I restriction enzyme M protein